MSFGFETYTVGEPFPHPVPQTHVSGQFDLGMSGATFIFFVNKPSLAEVKQFREGGYSFAFVELAEVVMFLGRIGQLLVDAPFSPHIGDDYTPKDPDPGMGLAMSAMLVDTSDGIIKGLRAIGLSNKFTRQINRVYKEYSELPFDLEKHQAAIDDINRRYSVLDLWKFAKHICKGTDYK